MILLAKNSLMVYDKAHCRAAGTRKHDLLLQSFRYRSVELLVELVTSSPKHSVDYSLGIKKEISILLIVDLLIFAFLACVSLECDIPGYSVSFRGRTEPPKCRHKRVLFYPL
ncbi:hypothetical protein AVEN_235900-1 [Araneus ventricosus]|uniref:Uncharacterized protein n=1 Tax=Araneus ventricosus TaxID=182803 RepID=A0A4Y2NIL1_ARAVE|nr:hypothetical protein AVEN_235900-1 [Araneus ventricosus]